MAFALTDEQKIAVENRGGALLVSAAAGSGKTRVLVERLMDYVTREGQNIDRFLVITFTNAAAAELRGRIAQALAERLAEKPHDRHLRRQTTLVYQAKICTIDSFCIDFLRECGHLADVDPDFRICDEAESAELLNAALDTILERRYANIEHDPAFLELAEALAGDRDDQSLADVVLDIHRRVQSHPDPIGWLKARQGDFALDAGEKPEKTRWGKLILDDAAATADYWAKTMEDLLNEASYDDVVYANYGPGLEETVADLKKFAAACKESWEKAAGCEIRFARPGAKRNGDVVLRERVKEMRARCKKQMEALEERFSLTAEEAMDDLRAIQPAMSALLSVVAETDRVFREEKSRRRLLDFSDAEHLAVKLLANPDGTPTKLAKEWQSRFTEIMVDEYQDTNEVQNVLFNALSQNGQNLFLVGDVKQSIYRFRLADPGIFLKKYMDYALCAAAKQGEPRKTVLSKNFRSRPEVLAGANFVFRGIMSEEFGELDYTDAEALHPGLGERPVDENCKTELNVIDLTELSDDEEDGKTPKPLVQARAVAKRAVEYLKGGLHILEGDTKRPVRPEDMVVLLRSPGPVLRYFAQAFDEAGVPWSADGGEEFFDTTEIHTALSFLQIIDNPRQDVPLLSVLRSPAYHFEPDRLAMLRAGAKGRDFYSALCAGAERGEQDCAQFLNLLSELRSLAGELSSHQLIWELYGRVNLPAIFGAMEGGARRRANLMALYDAALRFESGGHKGLYGFLSHIARMLESGQTILVPKEEQGGVRIMSIHRSKGLEFPVVFLCGLDRQFNDGDLRATILFHPKLGLGPKRTDRKRMLRYTTIARDATALALKKESRAEEMRLLYVAMTRAEQKLVMFTTVNGAQDKLTSLAGQASWPAHAQALQSCRAPAGWVLLTTLCRPEAGELRALAGAEPDRCENDGYEWDIRILNGVDYERALRHRAEQEEAKREATAADPALVERLRWVYPHKVSVDMPSKLTATQLKGREKDAEIAEHTSTPRKQKAKTLARPRFAEEEFGLTAVQRGTALHQTMQFIDYGKAIDVDGVRGEVARLVEQRFLTPEQGAAVPPETIAEFFQSEFGQRLLRARRMEREFKFSLLVPATDYYPDAEAGEEVLLQGVVDCWFEDKDGVTVLDFKTDDVTEGTVGERAAGYASQLEAYSRALGEVLGQKVEKKVLWFFRLGRGVEV